MASRLFPVSTRKPKIQAKIKSSTEEAVYRSNRSIDVGASNVLSCTKCNVAIKPRLVTENNVHPIIEVLLCKKCCHFFNQREVESNNIITYCRWCANNYNLLNCSTCPAKFCEGCINKHFHRPSAIFKDIREKKWRCWICESKPIWPQRALCAAAKDYAEECNNALKERIARCSSINARSSFRASSNTSSLSTSVPIINYSRSVKHSALVQDPQKDRKIKTPKKICQMEEKQDFASQFELKRPDCVICLLNLPTMAVYPCGHKCLCEECSKSFSRQYKHCPLCRKDIKDIIRLYEL